MASRIDSTNVVRLPTAASRKVMQPCNKAARLARWQLREDQRGQFNYVFPSVREAEARIRALDHLPDTAAVNIVRGIIRNIGTDDCHRVLRMIRCGVDIGDGFAREVEAVLEKVAGTTIGEHADFQNAITRLGYAQLVAGEGE